MKIIIRYSLLVVLSAGSQFSHGQKTQQKLDIAHLTSERTSILAAALPDTLSTMELNKIEATVDHINKKIDSLQALKLPTDLYQRKLDSISTALNRKMNYQSKLDSISFRLKKQMNYQQKMDSISGKVKRTLTHFTSKQDSLRMKVSQHAFNLQKKMNKKASVFDSLSLQMKDPLSGKTFDNGVGGVGSIIKGIIPGQTTLTGSKITLPQGGIRGRELGQKANGINSNNPLSLPTLNQGKTISGNNRNSPIQNFTKETINEQGVTQELKTIQSEVQRVKTVTNKVQTYKDDAREIGQGNVDKVKTIPKEVEDRVANMTEVKDLQTQKGEFTTAKNSLEQYKNMMAELNKKKPGEKELKSVMSKELTDPFAGQDAKLKAGIAQLDKLKKKYRSIADSRYLPKHVPNEMKGKPMRERLLPGISFQFYKNDDVSIDFSPYVSYKLSGRFRPGIGATWREAILLKSPYARFDQVYGLRVMNEFRLNGSFYFHTEGEWLHFTPAALQKFKFPADTDMSEWLFRLNAGLFKTYPISKRFGGQVQILYNVLDMNRFPQSRNTSMRFGIEYKFKAKR